MEKPRPGAGPFLQGGRGACSVEGRKLPFTCPHRSLHQLALGSLTSDPRLWDDSSPGILRWGQQLLLDHVRRVLECKWFFHGSYPVCTSGRGEPNERWLANEVQPAVTRKRV